jgi:hypothetical protein
MRSPVEFALRMEIRGAAFESRVSFTAMGRSDAMRLRQFLIAIFNRDTSGNTTPARQPRGSDGGENRDANASLVG